MLEVFTAILAIAVLIDLCWRIKQRLDESVTFGLTSPESVLDWQHAQVARSSYLGAQKLLQLSRKLDDPERRAQVMDLCESLVQVRKRIYEKVKAAHYDDSEFETLSSRADDLFSQYLHEVSNASG